MYVHVLRHVHRHRPGHVQIHLQTLAKCVCIYIYIERERGAHVCECIHVCVYTCICVYVLCVLEGRLFECAGPQVIPLQSKLVLTNLFAPKTRDLAGMT